MEPNKVLMYPLMTEKSMDQTDKENKLIFIVDRKAKKLQIREAIEKAYKVKVSKISTQITTKGLKKAFIQLEKEFSAEELVSRMGVV